MAVKENAESLLTELLQIWGTANARPTAAPPPSPATHAVDLAPLANPALSSLGTELGERLVSEILDGVKAGRQGVFVSEPERLRTAIFLRGESLGEFAHQAGLAPSTLSRALAGQPIAPSSWRSLITTLRQL